MTQFATDYHQLSDDELLQLWVERTQLTGNAKEALRQEIRRRGIADEAEVAVDQRVEPPHPLARPMSRALRFCGHFVLNLAVAVFGTGILVGTIGKLVPVHSLDQILWRGWILSITCAAVIGFGMWRTWRNSAAKWIWVLPAIWFTVGLLVTSGHGNAWGRLSGFSSESVLTARDARSLFLFTVPLVEAISYSVGAYISSLLLPTPVLPEY
jgi:hypothetical protein